MILPQKVLLRCNRLAILTLVLSDNSLFPWKFQGITCDDHDHQLWREDGRWRDDGSHHPLDIVGLVDPSGSVKAYGAAAGQKGPL